MYMICLEMKWILGIWFKAKYRESFKFTFLLYKSVQAYDSAQPDKIPYKEELGKTLDYNNALEKAPSPLVHNMELRTKLPKEIKYIKEKYL